MLVAVALFGIHSTSYATAWLYFDEGADSIGQIQVFDNGSGDSNTAEGAITYNSAIGNWTINVTTGLTKPILGSSTYPYLDLNSVNVSSNAAGKMLIAFYDDGFTGNYPFVLRTGGTTSGAVEIQAWADGTEFAPVTYGPGAFSDTRYNYVPNSSEFAAEIIAVITHGECGGISSFDIELKTVPEPVTMLLLGFGLLGLAGLRKRD